MNLADVVNGPWAITPAMLEEIQGIYAVHMRGEKIDIAGVEARIGRPLNNQPKAYEVIDGVALIDISGPLAKKANLFHAISGGASYQVIESQIRQALADVDVESIALNVDSPGGTVDGAFELAAFIEEAKATKPIEAFSDGMMASAAYLIAAATDKITLIEPGSTNIVGSIGVICTHTHEAQEGRTVTHIASGKYKALGSQDQLLSEDALAEMQGSVDYLATIFIDNVATARGLDAATVAGWEGKVFTGQQSIDAGLVDGVSTFEALMARLADGVSAESETANMRATEMSETNQTLAQLKEESPELYQEALAEGKAEGMQEGAAQESARIKGVLDQCAAIPGHEDLGQKLAFDGKTTAPEAAIQILAAEKSSLSKVAKTMEDEAPEPVADAEPVLASADQFTDIEAQAKATWKKDGHISEAACLAYHKANEAGRVNILNTGSKK